MKKIHQILISVLLISVLVLFASCDKADSAASTCTVYLDGVSKTVTVGARLEKPVDPTKESTAEKVFTFEGWFIKGTDTRFNFETDSASEGLELVSRFTESARLYSVKIGDAEPSSLPFGSKLTKPADPADKIEDGVFLIFDAWYAEGSDTPFNFDTDTVSSDITLTARFKPEETTDFILTVRPSVIVLGDKTYSFFSYTADDYKAMKVTILDKNDNEILSRNLSEDGTAKIALPNNTYSYKVETKDGSFTDRFIHSHRGTEVNIEVSRNVAVGGSMGTKGDKYQYPSYGSNYTYSSKTGELKLSNFTYVFLGDGVLTDTVYVEANVTFPSAMIGSMVGIMPACEFGNLSSDANKALAGSSDKNAKKLVFSFSGSNCLYSQSKGGYGGGDIVTEKKLDIADHKADAHKLGVLRNGYNYYIFVDGVLITTYYTEDYGKSGFGFALTSRTGNGSVTFSDIKYITDKDVIADMTASIEDSAEVEKDSSLTLTQSGRDVGDTLLCSIATKVTHKLPEGSVLLGYSVTKDGKAYPFEYTDDGIVFRPIGKGKYEVKVVYEQKKTSALKISVKPYTLTLDGVEYPLRSFSIAPSDVKLTVYSYATNKTETVTLDSLTKTLSLENGRYKLTATYKSNVYEKDVELSEKGAEASVYVSDTYLGGKITLGTNTFYSFNDVSETAAAGENWALVDGRRDSVKLTNHTFLFQNGFTGTKYYVEGTFDATALHSNLGSTLGGLLVSHGPKDLKHSSDVKIIAGIYGKSVVLCISSNWEAKKTITLANYTDFGVHQSDSVRLGVVRDGCNYYFFVNDVFVAYRYLDNVTTECGIGAASLGASNETIRGFAYSDNTTLINALIDKKVDTPKSIDIYLIAGQSNASGYTAGYRHSLLATNDALVYGCSNVLYAGRAQHTLDAAAGTFSANDLDWGLARFGQGFQYNRMGAEAAMALALSEYYNAESGKMAGIIKFAHGGTSLFDNAGGENNCSGNWAPPSYAATLSKPSSKCGGLYKLLLEQVKARVASLREMGYTDINLKGMFWMQGEADRGNPTLYKTVFAHFLSDIRKDLGEIMGEDLSDFAIIIGEISRTSGNSDSATQATNKGFIKAQNALATTHDNVYVVKSGDFDINAWIGGKNVAAGTDSWHWNENDMLEIGKMVGECIIENLVSDK